MKHLSVVILAVSALTLSSCKDNAASKVDKSKAELVIKDSKNKDISKDYPVMTFTETSHDFGVINEGDKVNVKFSFTNTGSEDLIIREARGSCGCTVPEYPKNTPIAPGDGGEILVSFDSNSKPGNQQKSVTLTTNTATGRELLRIKALVNPDPVKQKLRDEQMKARQLNN